MTDYYYPLLWGKVEFLELFNMLNFFTRGMVTVGTLNMTGERNAVAIEEKHN